jgi:hypothetical protein
MKPPFQLINRERATVQTVLGFNIVAIYRPAGSLKNRSLPETSLPFSLQS